jgi:uncharacterized protein (TIGR02996 family)
MSLKMTKPKPKKKQLAAKKKVSAPKKPNKPKKPKKPTKQTKQTKQTKPKAVLTRTARNEEMEAAIEQAPSDPERFLVYADWLQQQGDPRGELIVLQHAIADGGKGLGQIAKLEQQEKALFKKYEKELLGPLAPFAEVKIEGRVTRGLAWRYGFVRALRLPAAFQTSDRRAPNRTIAVRTLLQHPAGRFVERLVISDMGEQRRDTDPFFDLLEKSAPSTLTSLVIGWGRLDRVWRALPQLRTLILLSSAKIGDDGGVVIANALERLDARYANPKEIANATWPALKQLAIGGHSPTASDLTRILDPNKTTPLLEHLRVTAWTTQAEQLPVPEDTHAFDVLRAVVERGKKLARLDLCVPFSADGSTKFLEMASAINKSITELRLPKLAVTAGVNRKDLRAAIPCIVWIDDPLEEEEHENLDLLHNQPSA